MKTLSKFLVPVVALATIGISAFASPGVRGAKGIAVINNSATASEICLGHCTVYSVLLSSGAATDQAVLRDTNTANTSSLPTAIVYHVTAGQTQVTFDPPLVFKNGVSLNCPATTVVCGATFEPGDVTQGY